MEVRASLRDSIFPLGSLYMEVLCFIFWPIVKSRQDISLDGISSIGCQWSRVAGKKSAVGWQRAAMLLLRWLSTHRSRRVSAVHGSFRISQFY